MKKTIMATAIAALFSLNVNASATDVLVPSQSEITIDELLSDAARLNSAVNTDTLDVVIFYQNAHVERLGYAELERRAQAYESYFNDAAQQSGMDARVRIAYTSVAPSIPDDIPYSSVTNEIGLIIEPGASALFQAAVFNEDGLDGIGAEPERLSYLSYGGDVVQFIRDFRPSDGIESLGLASIKSEFSVLFDRTEDENFNHVFAHEIAHNLGGNHETTDSNTTDVDARAFLCEGDLRSIVYSSSNPNVDAGIFSSPTVMVNGEPCGVLGEADNARAMDAFLPTSAARRDAPVSTSMISLTQSVITANEADGFATVNLTRTGDISNQAAVTLFAMPDTALAQADYLTERVDVAFEVGQSEKSVVIDLVEDGIAEEVETINLMLRYPLVADVDVQNATLSILDGVTAAVGDFTVSSDSSIIEGEPLTVTIDRDNGVAGEVVLSIAASENTNDNSVTAEDVNLTPQQVIFADGEVSKLVVIESFDDDINEGSEQFDLTVTSAQEVVINNNNFNIVVLDNDVELQPGILSISSTVNSINDAAGTVDFTINRASGSDGDIDVTVSVDSTTVNGAKVVANESRVLTMANGETSLTVSFAVNNIDLTSDATVTATVSSDDAAIGTSEAIVTVNADPVTPTPTPPPSGGGSMGVFTGLFLGLAALLRRRKVTQ